MLLSLEILTSRKALSIFKVVHSLWTATFDALKHVFFYLGSNLSAKPMNEKRYDGQLLNCPVPTKAP